jgi:uncharacterized membrane protein YgcG
MKKILTGMVMMLVCAIAFAMPSPRQIEDALASSHYTEAKSMLSEVLREKPDSARAHLLNAYVLIHADKNKVAANTELSMAKALDKKGDVKNSPLFGRVVTEIELMPAVPKATTTAIQPVQAVKTTQVVPAYQPVQNNRSNGLGIVLVLLGVGGIILIAWIIVRVNREERTVTINRYYDSGSAYHNEPAPRYPSGGYRADETQVIAARNNGHNRYEPASVIVQPAVMQQNPAMGAFGTAAAVAGGVVAGNVVSDMLHHRHSHSDYDYEEEERRKRRRREQEESYQPAYQPPVYTPEPEPVVSTSNYRSSFSSSTDDDDTWTKSSSSSSSSYSSGDSSSSWDSGSSSSDSGSSSSDW